MAIVIIAIVFLVFAFVAAIIALLVVRKNQRIQRSSPEVNVEAKVIGTYANEQAPYTVDSPNAKTTSTYTAEFVLNDKTKLKFRINKKLFLSLHDGDKGILVYKGNKVISFSNRPAG